MTDVRLTATNPEDASVVPVACNAKGMLKLEEPIKFDGNLDGNLDVDGSAVFTGAISAAYTVATGSQTGAKFGSKSTSVNYPAIEARNYLDGFVFTGTDAGGNVNIKLKANGTATFANGKAGFTEEGYLFCTTERGDTVYLQGTSNGVGLWAAYTPPSRKDLVEDKLEEWSESKKDKLEEWSEKDKPSET